MEGKDSQFEISIIVKEDSVSVTAIGEYSLTKANHLFKTAVDQGVLHSKRKLFIDIRNISGSIPFMDRFTFSEYLANYRLDNASSKVNAIAVLGLDPIVHKDRFGETVAVNRGTNVRVFTDQNEAFIWFDEQ